MQALRDPAPPASASSALAPGESCSPQGTPSRPEAARRRGRCRRRARPGRRRAPMSVDRRGARRAGRARRSTASRGPRGRCSGRARGARRGASSPCRCPCRGRPASSRRRRSRRRAATASPSATADLPTAVGPTTAMTGPERRRARPGDPPHSYRSTLKRSREIGSSGAMPALFMAIATCSSQVSTPSRSGSSSPRRQPQVVMTP